MALVFLSIAPALAGVAANSVTSASIVDGAIKAVDIANGAVTRAKIAGGAVNSAKIADGSIKAVDIANGAVNSAKIADGSIKNVDIAAGAAIAASKINRTGLNADLLDGKHGDQYVSKTGGAMSGTLSAPNFSYTATRTGYFSIPPVAYVPGFGANIITRPDYMHPGATAWQYFHAPVALPQGSVVTSFRARLYDTTDLSYQDVHASLERRPIDDQTTSGWTEAFAMARLSTAGSTSGWQTLTDNTINNPTIDNSAYVYYVQGQAYDAGGSHRVGTMRITYTYTAPGP
jgi:hypothetical protein